MPSPTPRRSTSVSVNGPALRLLRQIRGVAVADIVATHGLDPSTISKLETGRAPRCRAPLFAALLAEIGLTDRRALIACPDHTAPDQRADLDTARTVEVNGSTIRAVREAIGETRASLATRAGHAENYLCRLENGTATTCSVEVLDDFARALGVADRRALMACPYGGDVHQRNRTAHAASTEPAPVPTARPGIDPEAIPA